ncbi:DUF881 domain-containing protein [Microlunatus aurantiacus]|uniref:DUF881 domain-containing protein n=1 Tax=Microlunatus aurantiacus TaxID=446786 RepID=UPI0031D56D89
MSAPTQGRRLDASMDLLRQITEQPIDPDYAVVAARGEPADPGRRRRPLRWALTLATVLAGALFAIGAVQNTQRAPVLATERQELIARIGAAETTLDAQREQVAALDAEIGRLRTTAAAGDTAAEARLAEIDRLGVGVGTVAVAGPGIVITVDDAPGSDADPSDRVLDLDLQILVNGLWESGAEAVAVNGHRLSPLTAIRGAGQAITVDYRSLTRPYRIEAVGDARTLPASFTQTSAGAWWNDLSRNRGMSFTLTGVDELTLDADPGIVLRYARPAR